MPGGQGPNSATHPFDHRIGDGRSSVTYGVDSVPANLFVGLAVGRTLMASKGSRVDRGRRCCDTCVAQSQEILKHREEIRGLVLRGEPRASVFPSSSDIARPLFDDRTGG